MGYKLVLRLTGRGVGAEFGVKAGRELGQSGELGQGVGAERGVGGKVGSWDREVRLPRSKSLGNVNH